eukprot:sb/3471916/
MLYLAWMYFLVLLSLDKSLHVINNITNTKRTCDKQPIRTCYLGHVTGYQPIRTRYSGHVTGNQPIRDQRRSVGDRVAIFEMAANLKHPLYMPAGINKQPIRTRDSNITNLNRILCRAMSEKYSLASSAVEVPKPVEWYNQPIRTRYLFCLGHVNDYQPIRDQYFLIRSVPGYAPL